MARRTHTQNTKKPRKRPYNGISEAFRWYEPLGPVPEVTAADQEDESFAAHAAIVADAAADCKRGKRAIEEINSTQNKDARIQSLQPFVKNGYIKFSKKHKTLLKQMTEYPMGKNDDAPDGLQMAVKLALDVKIGRRVDYRSVIARALDFRRGAY